MTDTARLFDLTVVIPTFNRVESLKVTLDSLAHQDYKPGAFEVVVVSDGSTDGTDDFLAQYAQNASFALRPVTQKNGGPARARNRGVEEARGEVIVFLDDDVEAVPGFLSAHMAYHHQEDKCVVIGPMSPDPARSRAEPAWIAWEHAMLQSQYANFINGVWRNAGPNHFYTGNASVRREHLVAVGGFDVNFKRQEDVELAYRMERERGVRFVFEPKANALHRPIRSYASWLNVAASYGQLDVVRARSGDIEWDILRHGYVSRSRPTRAAADIIMAYPAASVPIYALLRAGAAAAYRCNLSKVAIGALSVIYNVRYLQSAQQELGHANMKRVLNRLSPSS